MTEDKVVDGRVSRRDRHDDILPIIFLDVVRFFNSHISGNQFDDTFCIEAFKLQNITEQELKDFNTHCY